MEERFARQYILLHPDDCKPPHGLDLEPGGRDALKVEVLEAAFRYTGFDPDEPALVGYPLAGKVQLLTGTHRHTAAKRAGIYLPVRLVLRSLVEAHWGTNYWDRLCKDVPVKELEMAMVLPGDEPPGIDERVDLERDMT